MKKLMTAGLFVLMLALFAVSAAADLTVEMPSLGDDNQERGVNVTDTFTVTNSGNETVSGISITSALDAKYIAVFSNVPTSLAADGSQQVTLQALVPLDHDAIDEDFKETALIIGSFTVDGTDTNGSVTTTSNVEMQAENQLKIDKAKFISDDGKSETIKDGDKVDDLKPGEGFSLEITVENKFSDNDDIDIDDALIEAFTDDDDDIDVDEDDDVDVRSDDKEEVTFDDLDVEDDASDGTVDLTIQVSGTDDNGALHGEKFDVDLDVERKSHEIKIDSLDVSPTTVSCGADRNLRADVRITNIGKRDEDDVVVRIDAAGLGFSDSQNLGTLDEDDSDSARFTITVGKNVQAGTYTVEAETFYDFSASSDRKSLTVAVQECADATAPAAPTTPTVAPAPAPVPAPAPAPIAAAPKAAVKSDDGEFKNSALYMGILGLAIVIVLAIAIVLIVNVAKAPKKLE